MTHRILFVSTEVRPYIKVGGLADVAAGLPAALAAMGHEVRVLVPATAAALRAAQAEGATPIATRALAADVQMLELPLAGPLAKVWLLDTPGFRRHSGTPYQDDQGEYYLDDAERYDELARIAVQMAAGAGGWTPDVVHCNEWHTGLVPVHLLLQRVSAASVFTIHNLEYQGVFPAATFNALGLPAWLWHPDSVEFHGSLNFMKAGLVFSDRLTAVSPGYSREILTSQFGAGLDGVLRKREAQLQGIINGIDPVYWDPAHNTLLASHFDSTRLEERKPNRASLYHEFGLADHGGMLLGVVARLVAQKGIDIILKALPALLKLPVQCVILGSGDMALQKALIEAAGRHPDQLAVRLGHDEKLANGIYAGCDALLMPSRFEPCGLSQLYAMRYGALPIVHRTGGLSDTVRDAAENPGNGNGFVFDGVTPAALTACVRRAVETAKQPSLWRQMMMTAMDEDFSWERSAQAYVKVYESALKTRRYT
ncbi:MAG TPA: glycogen synthase GlgA [Gammaproteobacteria bacterium]|jgi:starch synthase